MNKILRNSFGALMLTFSYNLNADISISGLLTVNDKGVNIPGVLTVDDNGVNIPGILQVNNKGKKSTTISHTSSQTSHTYIPNSTNKRSFTNKDMSRSDFSHQDFSNSVFTNVDGSRSDFTGANLSGSVFINSDFTRANFTGANLSNTKFLNVDLSRATMNNVCYSYAKVTNSNLTRVNLGGAVLIGTDFNNCELYRVSKKGAIYTGVPRCARAQQHTQVIIERENLIKSEEIQEALLTKKTIDLTINFEFDSDEITGEAHKQIFEIAQALKSNGLANSKIQIQGHTDSRGSESYNLNLSNKRAMSVMRELVYKDGFSPSKFLVKGFGESQPIATNMYEQGRSLNRRVTLVNISR